ncbi:MAG: dTDP-4-dehydrorhamnose reductase [Balneolaceae bacterium]
MRFLITGGNGQLGREWGDFLTSQKADFEAFSSSDLDITNKEEVEKKLTSFKPDVLINCAAYTKVDMAEDEEEQAFLVNAKAVDLLAEICAANNIKLVHYSTDYVFAGTKEDHQVLEDGYPEDHEKNPVNVYGASKLAGETAILKSGCDFLLIRVSWLCGQYGHNFVKTMLNLAETRDALNVVNDQFGSPTFAENVVENTFHLLQEKQSGIFHLSSLGKATWYDFASEIFQQKKMDISVHPVDSSQFPTKATRPAFSLLSTKKIANIPGVSLVHWKTGLTKLLKQI